MRCRTRVACVVLLGAALLAGCAIRDSEYTQRQLERRIERATSTMRKATRQAPRSEPVTGEQLRALLVGRTVVSRYDRFPGGGAGDYVVYRHFVADGRLQLVDNWLHPSDAPAEPDRWSIDGARLCLLEGRLSITPRCFTVGRTGRGVLLWFVDDPEAPYHGLLSVTIDELIDGPPPRVESVLAPPDGSGSGR